MRLDAPVRRVSLDRLPTAAVTAYRRTGETCEDDATGALLPCTWTSIGDVAGASAAVRENWLTLGALFARELAGGDG